MQEKVAGASGEYNEAAKALVLRPSVELGMGFN